jgi:hypothetical protein
MTDTFYTPTWVADAVASVVPADAKVVVDVAAGRGALLAAVDAPARGLDHRVFAFDRAPESVRLLKSVYPHWQTGRMDFLSERSRNASLLWRSIYGRFDIALLNPPYSYRGGAGVPVRWRSNTLRGSPAAAFVAGVLQATAQGGTVLAILPVSSRRSERDEQLWSAWYESYHVEVVQRFPRRTFAHSHANTELVAIRKSNRPDYLDRRPRVLTRSLSSKHRNCVELIRGRVPMHEVPPLKERTAAPQAPIVHTTNLHAYGLVGPYRLIDASLASTGDMVLLPRVGRMSPTKVVTHRDGQPIVLSDCVIGLRVCTEAALTQLHERLLDSFGALVAEYEASCAPYITTTRLLGFLAGIGFDARTAPADSNCGGCASSGGENWCRTA